MSELKINDIVQVQTTAPDIEHVGLVGYVSKVTASVISVDFYHAQEKGTHAFVTTVDFLPSQLFFVGTPNPELLPL